MVKQNKEDIIQLTAAELTDFWKLYQYESLSWCGLTFFLTHVDDEQIRKLLEHGLQLTEKRKKIAVQYLKKANYPIPQGFTEQDVILHAPRLFSDKLYLFYLLSTTQLEVVNYGEAVINAARSDVIHEFYNILVDSLHIHIEAKELMKEKGIFLRIPSIPPPNKTDFVRNESFIKGWLGERRSLVGTEITNLTFNAKRNALGQAVITAFSQVVQSKEIQKYFKRGRDIARKHLDVFSNILKENQLGDSVVSLSSEITDSTEPPFSDKLMLNFISILIPSGIGNYGLAVAMSPRRDIGIQYTRLIGEIAKYAEDGIELLIKNGWLEQPPTAIDREGLAK